MADLVDCLTRFSHTKGPCIITGVLNCGDINWSQLTAPNDSVQDKLLIFSMLNGFKQLVPEPSRLNNILDVVFCNEPLSICELSLLPPLGKSDHSQIAFSVFIDNAPDIRPDCHYSEEFYDWNSADYESIIDDLMCINW